MNSGIWFLRLAAPLVARLRRLQYLPLVGSRLRNWSYRLFPPSAFVPITVQNGPAEGLKLTVHPRIGELHLRGTYSPPMQQMMVHFLRPGMMFYDIGAHIGFATLLGARLVGPSGSVVSFEADPSIVPILKDNVARNGFENVTIVPRAVWSSSGQVTFVQSDRSLPDRGTGKVSRGEPASTSLSIESISLSDATKIHGPPDFIKCDTEGAEVEIFVGQDRLLRSINPVVFCEYHSGANRRDLERMFSDFGYSVAALDEPGTDPSTQGHVLAVPRGLSMPF